MTFLQRFSQYLERRWVAPAYVGWVLLGLAVFFFAAATNTLAGWLYVMSGVLLALLAIAAILPPRNLTGIKVERQPIHPVAAGDPLLVELRLENVQRYPKVLFQAIDPIPPALGQAQSVSIRVLNPGVSYLWSYQLPTSQRGCFNWSEMLLRSAAPLGLFWCNRKFSAAATAIIYPQILRLNRCPLVDVLGTQNGQQWQYSRSVESATEGITRSLRPYRWGDPTRLIHWRTSARYGELRIRELETVTSGQEVLIALNQQAAWTPESFEQAVVTAASLFAYAHNRGLATALWMTQTGTLRDYTRVMAALAEVAPVSAPPPGAALPRVPLLWLTEGSLEENLPPGSQHCCWGSPDPARTPLPVPTVWIDPQQPLLAQLQLPPVYNALS